MNITSEQLQQLRNVKTADELQELSESHGVNLTTEQSQRVFSQYFADGFLSDDELDNVAGGGCSSSDDGDSSGNLSFEF